ncbi:MAG: hypothetical protein H6741_01410 [Alphaproteobacteria bacterium]|nr:hypothetical protein [Alphaproteobacteria bacterium]
MTPRAGEDDTPEEGEQFCKAEFGFLVYVDGEVRMQSLPGVAPFGHPGGTAAP